MGKSVPIQKKVIMASIRVLNRSLISVVLIQAKTAQLLLDPGAEQMDSARRATEIRTASNVINLIDDVLITLEANREQRAEIKKARDALADRVKNLGHEVSA